MKNTSGIITFSSDFGLIDHYVGMVKGVILSINRQATLVDITHRIRVGSIFEAADLVRETFVFFPAGTVHLAVVDPGVGGGRRPLALEAEGHFFVGPDNGIFWPIIRDHRDARSVHLTNRSFFLPSISYTFHAREIFAPVAAHLSLGVELESMGALVKDPVQLQIPKALRKGDTLYGQVIRVDHFGNLITNIHRTDLVQFLKSAFPLIELGQLAIKNLSEIYSDGEEGEVLALINSSGRLEIAVNLGRASEYAGLNPSEILGAVVKVTKCC
jgi:S-adenosylmethionine hydrolase